MGIYKIIVLDQDRRFSKVRTVPALVIAGPARLLQGRAPALPRLTVMRLIVGELPRLVPRKFLAIYFDASK